MNAIPWIKTEEMEFIDGQFLLAIKKHPSLSLKLSGLLAMIK
jgi:hypothetical protein